MAEKEKLIQTVFARSLLYNASLRGYRRSERRVDAWREIAASVGLSVVQCKMKREDLHYTEKTSRSWAITSGRGRFPVKPRIRHTHTRVSENEPLKSVQKALDEDELFLLSFVPALKRLTPQKRAAVKMQIQKIMFDAEFKDQ
ncbi:transcription factor Adf-1-like [Pimephales promelas]|nr:transcription factor Adf-1-like [Pimephales promelas]